MLGAIISVALLGATAVRGDETTYAQNAGCNNDQLERWFHSDVGLWHNDMDNNYYWWQSANMMHAFTDLAIMVPQVKSVYSYIWDNVYTNAPKNNPMPTKVKRADGTFGKVYEFPSAEEVRRRSLLKRAEVGFVGRFYDDEGWWALAFVAALDATGRREYLDEAIGIWYDMHDGWNKHKCGGIPWNKDAGQAPVSISNELYIQLGAALSNRVGLDQKNIYLDGAKQGWAWMQSTGVISSTDNLVMDGVDANTCAPAGPYYTYNQGVIVGGLVEMYRATSDASYLDSAVKIADAVTKSGSKLQDSAGILADGCDKDKTCSGDDDGTQFKGVFLRNLKKLYQFRPSDQYKTFILRNAQSIWLKDTTVQNGGCFNGVLWGGPYKAANPSSQSSALDCLNAAISIS
ncbi:Six-hairpin glycosidase [Thozetella sp. PMI_491]|nr:Six-hairpin glycosidase [Thozetella sp. PMI_491]